MIVERCRYPNQKEWLVVRFPALELSLYLTETSKVVKHLLCSPFKKKDFVATRVNN